MSNDYRNIRITLVKSVIGCKDVQRKTVQALGLRRTNTSVVHQETPQIRGMVNRVSHLLRIEEVEAE
jgi:large subunit ribosomal protein L30